MSEMELDFKKLAAEINKQIGKASEAMEVANELAIKAGVGGRFGRRWEDEDRDLTEQQEELIDGVSFLPLFRELRAAGWSTSSMSC